MSTIRKRRAEAEPTGQGAFPIDKSRAGFCGAMFGHQYEYGGEIVELTSNPFGYHIFFKIVTGPKKGELFSMNVLDSGDRLTPLES